MVQENRGQPLDLETGLLLKGAGTAEQEAIIENFPGKRLAVLAVSALILFGLFLSSLYSYLLFHSLVELFSIVIGCGIFIIAWNSRRILDNNYLLFLGIGYLFVAFLDLIHTLAYKGMPIFPGYGADLPTQLWIAARYMESLSLLAAPLFLRRSLSPGWAFGVYAIVTLLVIASLFLWHIFPSCFVDGIGLTPFKIISEYIISCILLAALIVLFQNRDAFDRDVFRWLAASIGMTIAAEIAFTFYVSVYGLSNLLGHFLKLASFYLIYKALIQTGLKRPYTLLFRQLKQNETALRKSEERYRTVANFTADWEYWASPTGDYVYMSPSSDRITGYPPNAFIDDPGLMERIIHPEDRPIVSAHMKQEKGSERLTPIDFRMITRSGQERWINHVCQPVFSDDGTYLGRRVSNRDVTDRKRAEEDVRLLEAKLRLAMRAAEEGLWEWDLKEGQVRFDEGALKMVGYSPGDITLPMTQGSWWMGQIHPEDRQGVEEKFNQYLSGESNRYHIQFRLKCRDGQYAWIASDAAILSWDPGGQPRLVVGIHRDISEQKEVQEALRQSRRGLAQIIDFLPDATFVIDSEGKVVAWNRAIEKMTGIRSEEMLGRGDYEYAIPFYGKKRPVLIDLVGTWDEETEKAYQYVKKEGDALVSETFDSLAAPGGALWNKASVIRDENGALIGAIESIRDISDRKEQEEEREKLITELQDALAKVKQLKGMLPICASCKKIRNDQGYWTQIEAYIRDHSEAQFSHGICPDCMKKLYPEFCSEKGKLNNAD